MYRYQGSTFTRKGVTPAWEPLSGTETKRRSVLFAWAAGNTPVTARVISTKQTAITVSTACRYFIPPNIGNNKTDRMLKHAF